MSAVPREQAAPYRAPVSYSYPASVRNRYLRGVPFSVILTIEIMYTTFY